MPNVNDATLADELESRLQELDERLLSFYAPFKAELDVLVENLEASASVLNDQIAVFEKAARMNPNYMGLRGAADAVAFALNQVSQQAQMLDAKVNAPTPGPFPDPLMPTA